MRNLNYQLKQLCDRNSDGSYATRNDRERILTLVANQLRELGYRHLQADSLKPKHVDALLARWQSEAIATGTVKNRMSALRWWAEKVDKQNVIAKSNDAYGIAERVHVSNVSKAKQLDADKLAHISDPYTAMSLRLEAAFGLGRWYGPQSTHPTPILRGRFSQPHAMREEVVTGEFNYVQECLRRRKDGYDVP